MNVIKKVLECALQISNVIDILNQLEVTFKKDYILGLEMFTIQSRKD